MAGRGRTLRWGEGPDLVDGLDWARESWGLLRALSVQIDSEPEGALEAPGPSLPLTEGETEGM